MNYPHKVPVFTIRMEPELKEKLQELAMKRDVPMAEVVRRLIFAAE